MTTDTTPESTSNPYEDTPVANMACGDLIDYLFGKELSLEKREKLTQVPLKELQKLAQEKRDQAKK